MQGNNGAPLNATGRAQASAVAQALKSELPFAMYTSPVRRALETAGIVSELLDVPAATLPELRELEVGELDGLTGDEMRKRYPEYMKDWSKDPATARPPGGETVQEVQEMAWDAVNRLLDRHPDDTVVAVSHNFTILTILAKVLDMPLQFFRRLQQDLAAITRLELSEGQGSLLSLNETWHLRTSSEE